MATATATLSSCQSEDRPRQAGSIRPRLGRDQAVDLIRELYELHAVDLQKFQSYDDCNFKFTAEDGGAKKCVMLFGNDFVLKVTNSRDSDDPETVSAQNEIMLHLDKLGLPVPVPVPNKRGSLQQLIVLEDKTHVLRVLKFIPGKTLYHVKSWGAKHFFQCGHFLAKVDQALKTFDHPALRDAGNVWYLSSVPQLRNFIFAVEGEERRTLLTEIIEAFETEVLTKSSELEKGVIHGDFNEQNILVRPASNREDDYEVFSVLDFGDSHRNCLVFDLAIAIMYMMTRCTELHPNLAGGHVLAGYLRIRQLSNAEMSVLRTCVAARYAQSLILGAYTYLQDPTNDYVLITAKNGWKVLADFWRWPKETMYTSWLNIVESYNAEENQKNPGNE